MTSTLENLDSQADYTTNEGLPAHGKQRSSHHSPRRVGLLRHFTPIHAVLIDEARAMPDKPELLSAGKTGSH